MPIFFLPISTPNQVTEVVDTEGYVDAISMSPGGNQLLLAMRKRNAQGFEVSRIFLLVASNGSLRQLTPDSDPDAGYPVFAHNGSDIIFNDGSTGNVAQVTFQWTNKRQLVTNAEGADVSSDGSWLLYIRQSAANPFARVVFVAAADGSNPQRVTPDSDIVFGALFNPAISNEIVYGVAGLGIVSIHVNGGGRRVLVSDPSAVEPRMRPDGQQLMFVSSVDRQIYVANANGSNPRRLTNDPTRKHRCPVYSPNGALIYFID